jgi:hypothetical protein
LSNVNPDELHAINEALCRLSLPLLRPDEDALNIGKVLPIGLRRIYSPGDAVPISGHLRRAMQLPSGTIKLSHYLRSEFALDLLRKQQIYLRPLTAQSDVLEYEHCYSQAFTVQPLVRLDKSLNTEWNAARAIGRDIFIFCATVTNDNSNHDRFWHHYGGGNSTGVRIDFELTPKSDELRDQWMTSLREHPTPTAETLSSPDQTLGEALGGKGSQLSVRQVIYDDGPMMDTFKEIRSSLMRCGTEMHFPGFAAIATCYKRKKYSWEREVRILLDTSGSSFDIVTNQHDRYLESTIHNREFAGDKQKVVFSTGNPSVVDGAWLSMENSQFDIKVISVQCGRNTPQANVRGLRLHCTATGIEFIEN